ncbi:hypothetical protein J2T13_004513 [Paenibacillus sp. DS2015]|uniref:hypothetical protein n=1 Tax=Paenibacillus sp. DS2015 TaxID=3373917 RepID=UPI003D24DE56
MNSKQIIIVGTMVFAITIGGSSWNNMISASSITKSLNTITPVSNDLLEVLELSSDDEIHDALYNGKTLADIAKDNDVDVQNVIDLQVAELTEQLDLRLANGSLTLEQYKEQKSEVRDIITNSAYGLNN